MKLPALFSDMDQTMIYSTRSVLKHHQTVSGALCVEVNEETPASFTGFETWKMLHVHAGKTFRFIPVTTRTLRQYSRIFFPEVQINHAVTLNGARIIVDGEEDYSWTKKIAAEVKKMETTPTDLWEHLVKQLASHEETHMVNNAEGFFPYIVTKTAFSPEVDAQTTKIAKDVGYTRSKQGRKTYLIPPNLSKGDAVEELISRLKTSKSYAAGDSLLDFTMHGKVDYFIQPAHGDKHKTSETFIRTKHSGLAASEEIVQFVLDRT